MPRSQPLSSPSSPSSRTPPPPSSEGTQPTAGAPPLQSVRRMGSMDRTAAMSMARKELVMALYELGMSYLKGWGVAKDKPVAFTYFKIAADLGDPDSQNETALCYYEGIGIEKDMYESAKYYRMASAQGASQLGNSWIWKPKYDQYCAAENAAVSAAATIGSVSVVTNATIQGTKKGNSKERAKRLTSAIQTAIATSTVPPASSNSTPAFMDHPEQHQQLFNSKPKLIFFTNITISAFDPIASIYPNQHRLRPSISHSRDRRHRCTPSLWHIHLQQQQQQHHQHHILAIIPYIPSPLDHRKRRLHNTDFNLFPY
ncbi:hypothetical protein BGZ89_000417 [Linnemannia elongata]|nr:hypothetical protein BGZ89_000417 [Linnemannia elongata]